MGYSLFNTNIYNLFRVSLFHSDETFCVYACTRSVFFQIRSIKKPVTFFKMVVKKLFSLQNVMKKIVGNALLFRKELSASLKIGNPPPPPNKNNGPSLTNRNNNA